MAHEHADDDDHDGAHDPAHGHPHDHDHDHDHGHDHGGSPLGPMDLRARALETVLTRKGCIGPAALDALIDT